MKISAEAATKNNKLINSMQKKWAKEEQEKQIQKVLQTTAKDYNLDIVFFYERVDKNEHTNA